MHSQSNWEVSQIDWLGFIKLNLRQKGIFLEICNQYGSRKLKWKRILFPIFPNVSAAAEHLLEFWFHSSGPISPLGSRNKDRLKASTVHTLFCHWQKFRKEQTFCIFSNFRHSAVESTPPGTHRLALSLETGLRRWPWGSRLGPSAGPSSPGEGATSTMWSSKPTQWSCRWRKKTGLHILSVIQYRVVRWSVLLIYSRQMQQQCWNDWEVKRETEHGGCWIRSGYKANSGQKQLTDYQSASAMASCLVGHHWLCQKNRNRA